jgi:type IV secretion system protein VirB6
MLGTVGVLVTARIALAVLLALGPVFVVMGLFPATRGLTAGWLRGVVMTAITPLFVVLGGGLMIELLVPVVNTLRSGEGIDGRAAMALFMIAAIHIALITMVLRVVGAMVSGWQVFGLSRSEGKDARQPEDRAPQVALGAHDPAPFSATQPAAVSHRNGAITAAALMSEAQPAATETVNITTRTGKTVITAAADRSELPPLRGASRARGIGSRYRPQPALPQGIVR